MQLALTHVSPVCAVSNGGVQQLAVNEQALRRAWESSQRSTKEDWAEWMRHFAVELLKESPSHALRATHLLAQVRPRRRVKEQDLCMICVLLYAPGHAPWASPLRAQVCGVCFNPMP